MTHTISRAVVAAAAAAAMMATPAITTPAHAAPAPAADSVVAKPGSRGSTVTRIQVHLRELKLLSATPNGIYGPQTTAAVKAFQKANRFAVTGVLTNAQYKTLNAKGMAAYRARMAKARAAAAAKAKADARIVARPGDRNRTVQQIQGRLNGVGYLPASSIIGVYGPATTAAVKKFQKDNRLPVTGVVNGRTHNLLITRYQNRSKTSRPAVKLDRRCLTGRALCIDKGDRKMYWVVNGTIQRTYNVRTGRASLPTRSGAFKVYLKHPNWYSTLYHVYMPYTMFFSGGQAVHYSSEFARIGYAGSGSHGCVNMNSRSDAKWLYSQVRVGDKVIVTA